MKEHAIFLVLVLFSFSVFKIFFVLVLFLFAKSNKIFVREHVLEQLACSFIPAQVHGRYKECRNCHSPRITTRATEFLNYLVNSGKKIFQYEFWNKIQKKIERKRFLDDEGNLYMSAKH